MCRGLRPSFSRCDFVLLSRVKGFGLPDFFVAGLKVEFGSPSTDETKEVSDFEGKEGADLWAELTSEVSALDKARLTLLALQSEARSFCEWLEWLEWARINQMAGSSKGRELSSSPGFRRVGIYLPGCFGLGLAMAGWSAPFIASRAVCGFWSPWVCVGRRSDDLAVLLKLKKKPCFGACFSSSWRRP